MPGPEPGGRLAAHVLHFARTLRAAGLPVGPGRVLDAVEAVAEVGIADRDDLYWALHAVLVSRAEHRALFDEAFQIFWREPEALPSALALLLSRSTLPPPDRRELTRRLAEALAEPRSRQVESPPERLELDAVLAWSDRERLQTRDFEQMTAAEVRAAEQAIARMRLPVRDLPTRRLKADPRGDRLDPRATLRAAARAGRDFIPLRWRSAARRPPAIVALCDISGSMARYSRMLLHFLHALTGDRDRVHSFTFGTRLTNVTRQLRHRDVDQALAAVGRAASDWEGGTRIGPCLREFNLRWARRVLGQGAVVLLITDGLDRPDGPDREGGAGGSELAVETERLRRSCRRLIWLNPLLRFAGFEPRAAGVRAMLPHVDEFRPVHDLASLEQLCEVLGGGPVSRRARSGSRAGRGRGCRGRACGRGGAGPA
jgi:uncharacterized protein with von Willebrand factor type A (vWA) domain